MKYYILRTGYQNRSAGCHSIMKNILSRGMLVMECHNLTTGYNILVPYVVF